MSWKKSELAIHGVSRAYFDGISVDCQKKNLKAYFEVPMDDLLDNF